MKPTIIIPYSPYWIELGANAWETLYAIGINTDILVSIPDKLEKIIDYGSISLVNIFLYHVIDDVPQFTYKIIKKEYASVIENQKHQEDASHSMFFFPQEYRGMPEIRLVFERYAACKSSSTFYYPLDNEPHQITNLLLQTLADYPRSTLGNVHLLRKHFSKLMGQQICFTGRVTRCRRMKGLLFSDCMQFNSSVQLSFDLERFPETPKPGDMITLEGTCYSTQRKEFTIAVEKYEVVASWNQEESYLSILKNASPAKKAFFMPGFYEKANLSSMLLGIIRDFMELKGFKEVITDMSLGEYNGGNSYPTEILFKSKRIGFVRTTFEEQLKGHLAAGFENIYQLGPVMRGGNEFTMLEGYSKFYNWQSGTSLCQDLLLYISQSLPIDYSALQSLNFKRIDFADEFKRVFGKENVKILNHKEMPRWLYDNKVTNNPFLSLEAAADKLAKFLCRDATSFCILEGYPIFSSPLYKTWTDEKHGITRLEQSKIGFKGNFFLDLGVEQTESKELLPRIKDQKMRLATKGREMPTESAIETIILGGVPPNFGFGASFTKLHELFGSKSC
jgi:lysyl-tRNA synthetase class II